MGPYVCFLHGGIWDPVIPSVPEPLGVYTVPTCSGRREASGSGCLRPALALGRVRAAKAGGTNTQWFLAPGRETVLVAEGQIKGEAGHIPRASRVPAWPAGE